MGELRHRAGKPVPPVPTGWGQWAQGALTAFTDIMRSTVLLLGPARLIVPALTGGTDRVFCFTALRDQLFPCNRGW